MAAESTSFIQFDYCNLCKISHKKQKKHVYSKRHQEILQNILRKYSKKIKDAKVSLNNPTVEALGWENGAQFWCYFCEMEADKHMREIDATVKYGGLIKHIATKEHVKKTSEFFWKNIIDKEKKSDYILREVDAERFSNKSDTALALYRQKMKTKIQQMAENIRNQEHYQNQIAKKKMKAPPWSQMCTKQNQISACPMTQADTVISKTSSLDRSNTTQAVSPQLTSIAKPKSQSNTTDKKDEVGNVFTGATPPWLMEDEEETGTGEIGPSLTEYDKHLEREKKKKLPPNRVGANFDPTSQTSATWMPSFSGVWNKGRRLDSKTQFDRRSGVKSQSGLHHATQPAARSSIPSTVMPYRRKNRTEAAPDVTAVQLIHSPLIDSGTSARMSLNSTLHQQSLLGYSSLAVLSSPLVPPPPSMISAPQIVHTASINLSRSETPVTQSQHSSVVTSVSSCSVSKSNDSPVSRDTESKTEMECKEDARKDSSQTSVSEPSSQSVADIAAGPALSENHNLSGPCAGADGKQSTVVESDGNSRGVVDTKRHSAPVFQPEHVVPYKRKKRDPQKSGVQTDSSDSSRPGQFASSSWKTRHPHPSVANAQVLTDSSRPHSATGASQNSGTKVGAQNQESRHPDGVGQMFTQAFDMAFSQQTLGRGNYHTPQNFHSNQNMYPNMDQYNFPPRQQWTDPRQLYLPQCGNNNVHSNPTRQFMNPSFVQSHSVYPSVHTRHVPPPMPPQRLPAAQVGSAAGPAAAAPAQSGGLNLFQSISAAVSTKLPN